MEGPTMPTTFRRQHIRSARPGRTAVILSDEEIKRTFSDAADAAMAKVIAPPEPGEGGFFSKDIKATPITTLLAVVRHVFSLSCHLTPKDRLVAICLANHLTKHGARAVAWPSMRILAEKTGLSRSTVLRAMPRLEAAGIFRRRRRSTRAGRLSDAYELLLDPPERGRRECDSKVSW